MIHYKISKNAKILFVGINPHPGSYRRGVPFSNNKMFWYLLNTAGLLKESAMDLKSDIALKHIYDTKFSKTYGLNFINLVDRPTIDVSELARGEEQSGVRRRAGMSILPLAAGHSRRREFRSFERLPRHCDGRMP